MLYKVALLTLILHVALVRSVRAQQYQQYHMETLCGIYQDKHTINLKSQPAIISLTSRIEKRMKCHLELRLSSDYFGFSVFIDSLKLDNTTGCSRDFLQFGRDFIIFTSFKSDRRCGTIDPSQRILRDDGSLLKIDYGESHLQQREYIEAQDDEMDIWVEIHPSEHHQPSKHLKLIVTPFKKLCSKNDYLYKQCPSNNKCIKRELFCDGVINCDGEEKDEKEEYCLKGSILPGSGIFMSIPVIIIVVIVSLVVIMGIIVFCKITISFFKPRNAQDTPTRRRSGDQSSCLTSARASASQRDALPDRRTIPPRGTASCSITPRYFAPRPSAPVMSMGNEGPYMSPLPPSYNQVMGIVYKEEPPKYSEFPDG